MNFKCIFGAHDVEVSCKCARCGKIKKGALFVPDGFGEAWGIDVTETQRIKKEIGRHIWTRLKSESLILSRGTYEDRRECSGDTGELGRHIGVCLMTEEEIRNYLQQQLHYDGMVIFMKDEVLNKDKALELIESELNLEPWAMLAHSSYSQEEISTFGDMSLNAFVWYRVKQSELHYRASLKSGDALHCYKCVYCGIEHVRVRVRRQITKASKLYSYFEEYRDYRDTYECLICHELKITTGPYVRTLG